MGRLKRVALLSALVTLTGASFASFLGHVSAHAGLRSSNPSDKQVLATAPSTVSMTFSENLSPAPGSFIVVSTGGADVSSGAATVSTTDTKTMTLPLKSALGSGSYSVFWKSTSADDGGVTFGHFTFFVGTPSAADVANTPAGASVGVPDAATDMALSAGGTRSVKLAAGCNMVASTFPDGTDLAMIAAAIVPVTTVQIWQYDATAGAYHGYSSAAPAASDLKSVDHLAAVWVCVGAASTLSEPAA